VWKNLDRLVVALCYSSFLWILVLLWKTDRVLQTLQIFSEITILTNSINMTYLGGFAVRLAVTSFGWPENLEWCKKDPNWMLITLIICGQMIIILLRRFVSGGALIASVSALCCSTWWADRRCWWRREGYGPERQCCILRDSTSVRYLNQSLVLVSGES